MNTLRPLPLLLSSRGLQTLGATPAARGSSLLFRAAVTGRLSVPTPTARIGVSQIVAGSQQRYSMSHTKKRQKELEKLLAPESEEEKEEMAAFLDEADELSEDMSKNMKYMPQHAHSKRLHGERIWVFHHIMTNQTVYSLKPVLDSNKAMRQFYFVGKKLVPAALRKDLWWPLLMIEFGQGKGDIGRSAFAKLRELQKMHYLDWKERASEEERQRLLSLQRQGERGRELLDQRGNTVADIAYVLAGRGKGNIVLFDDTLPEKNRGIKDTKVIQRVKKFKELGRFMEVEVPVEEEGKPVIVADEDGNVLRATTKVKLHKAKIYWANEQDQYYAQQWTPNVEHLVGLPGLVDKDTYLPPRKEFREQIKKEMEAKRAAKEQKQEQEQAVDA